MLCSSNNRRHLGSLLKDYKAGTTTDNSKSSSATRKLGHEAMECRRAGRAEKTKREWRLLVVVGMNSSRDWGDEQHACQ